MSFTLTCDECKSKNCRIDANEKERYIDIVIVCEDCGHED